MSEIKKISVNQRQSNIELLRIFAMLLIVAHHIAVHSGFVFSNDSITFNRLWIQLIQLGGKIGVNVFVLIAGYFGVSACALKTNKLVRLWLQIFCYSILFFIAAVVFSNESFNIYSLRTYSLPITYSVWWFASTYFVLYILSPFINKFLNSLSKTDYLKLLSVLGFIWCILPTIISVAWQSNSLLWFVFLYALAGYIRLHLDMSRFKSKYCFISAGCLSFLTYMSVVIFDILGTRSGFFANHISDFYDMQRLPVVLISITLFVSFLKLKIGHVQIINTIASATFGVYLIHDNKYVRYFLWKVLFDNNHYIDSTLLIVYTLFQIAAVYVVCTVIELLRIRFVEKNYLNLIDDGLDLIRKFMYKIRATKAATIIKSFLNL